MLRSIKQHSPTNVIEISACSSGNSLVTAYHPGPTGGEGLVCKQPIPKLSAPARAPVSMSQPKHCETNAYMHKYA